MRRMILLDQQKSIWAHACPPALHGVAIGFHCLLYLLALGRKALRADYDFLEYEERPKLNPVELLSVPFFRRIIKVYEHPHLLFIAPALVFGAQEAVGESGSLLEAKAYNTQRTTAKANADSLRE